MSFKKILQSVNSFLQRNKQSGTTTLIKKIASENDVYIIVASRQSLLEEFKGVKNTIPLSQFESMDGSASKPVLIDNHTLLLLSQSAIREIDDLEQKIKDRNSLLSKIKYDIASFEARHGSNSFDFK